MNYCKDCFHYKACIGVLEETVDRRFLSDFNPCADRCADYVSAADVAPRAEVERLTRICDSYAFQYGTVRDQLPIIQRVGADAASRIFEEIGALMKAHSIGDIDDHTLHCCIHALRQKYTGGEP